MHEIATDVAMDTLTIQTQNVEFRYKDRVVLSQITFTLGRGVFGLLGPNGAGKTTLLRILATALRPSAGTVEILGVDVARPHERERIREQMGYLPQQFGYYPSFTCAEFVEYFALLKGVPSAAVSDAVATALQAVGLAELQKSKLRTLSGGMVRRLGIAQAIVNEPAILLLDEPTVGLDPQQRITFRTVLRRLGQRSTVLVSTHLVEDVAAACDRVAILHRGQVAFSGTPADLIGQGTDKAPGDSPIERGYGAVLQHESADTW